MRSVVDNDFNLQLLTVAIERMRIENPDWVAKQNFYREDISEASHLVFGSSPYEELSGLTLEDWEDRIELGKLVEFWKELNKLEMPHNNAG